MRLTAAGNVLVLDQLEGRAAASAGGIPGNVAGAGTQCPD